MCGPSRESPLHQEGNGLSFSGMLPISAADLSTCRSFGSSYQNVILNPAELAGATQVLIRPNEVAVLSTSRLSNAGKCADPVSHPRPGSDSPKQVPGSSEER